MPPWLALVSADSQTFADVPPNHPYYAEIEWLYRNGYTAGCAVDPLQYCPDITMNRAESSVFVERGIHNASYTPADPASQVFADLALDSWAAKWVNALWQDQYTAGCGTNPPMFCPWQGHTRAEGCVFYLRMLNGAAFVPEKPTQQRFVDVALDTWYAKWVQAAYDAGLITPCQSSPEMRFCPNGPLSRGLAAYMMVQAKSRPTPTPTVPTPTTTSTPPTPPPQTPTPFPGSLPAFPGAEGFGAGSVGGRGGRVIEVTNVGDSGPGTLRACVEATGPRTCVFRVGGTIELASPLNIEGESRSFLTIAGQTAPGGGITLRNSPTNPSSPLILAYLHDVILRYIRVRPGPSSIPSDVLDGIEFTRDVYNVIVDHVSVSWATDENFTFWYPQTSNDGYRNITIQWSITSEGLNESTHPEGPHSKGMLIGDYTRRVSIHHNLFAHNDARNPEFKGATSGEVVNNVMYDWGNWNSDLTSATLLTDWDGSGPFFANIIGNHYIPGPSSNALSVIGFSSRTPDASRVYVRSNIGPGRTADIGDDCTENWTIVGAWEGIRACDFSETFLPSGIAVDSVNGYFLRDLVLDHAGATSGIDGMGRPYLRRDEVDQRVVADVLNGTGRVIDDPSLVGGWPILPPGTPYVDSDRDGMGDDWEWAYFGTLGRGSATDSSGDFDGDGYTDLEEFFNGTDPGNP